MQALSFGELLVDMVSPASNSGLAQSQIFEKAPGGAPANVAVGLQRLGIRAGFAGAVGDDPFGLWLRDIIAAEGVDVSNVVLSEARTTIAFVATRLDGKKDICFYRNPGADAQFADSDWKEGAFGGLKVLHCGSVSLSLEPCRAAQFAAVRQAREAGALISFDPNWRPSLWDETDNFREAHSLIWDMMPLADVVKVADEEWEFVTGTSDLAAGAAFIRSKGPRLVVVTRGPDGAYFNFQGGEGYVPGFTADFRDSLGAGDAFVAGLLVQILEAGGLDGVLQVEKLNEVLKFANACGALATEKPGAIPALPSRDEVNSKLASG